MVFPDFHFGCGLDGLCHDLNHVFLERAGQHVGNEENDRHIVQKAAPPGMTSRTASRGETRYRREIAGMAFRLQGISGSLMNRHNCCTLSHVARTGPLLMAPCFLPIAVTSREELRRANFLSSPIFFTLKVSSSEFVVERSSAACQHSDCKGHNTARSRTEVRLGSRHVAE